MREFTNIKTLRIHNNICEDQETCNKINVDCHHVGNFR